MKVAWLNFWEGSTVSQQILEKFRFKPPMDEGSSQTRQPGGAFSWQGQIGKYESWNQDWRIIYDISVC